MSYCYLWRVDRWWRVPFLLYWAVLDWPGLWLGCSEWTSSYPPTPPWTYLFYEWDGVTLSLPGLLHFPYHYNLYRQNLGHPKDLFKEVLMASSSTLSTHFLYTSLILPPEPTSLGSQNLHVAAQLAWEKSLINKSYSFNNLLKVALCIWNQTIVLAVAVNTWIIRGLRPLNPILISNKGV